MVDDSYSARLDIDYPDQLDRLTTFFRIIWVLPILVVLTLITATGNETVITEAGEEIRRSGGGIAGGLFVATMLMILFRKRYPRWLFDFARELARFSATGRRLSGATHRSLSLHGRRTVGPSRHRLSRRPTRPQPLAAIGEVATSHPPLHRPGGPWSRGDLRCRHRMVRNPFYRPLPAPAIRLRGRGGSVVTPCPGVRLPVGDRQIPALQPHLTFRFSLPATELRQAGGGRLPGKESMPGKFDQGCLLRDDVDIRSASQPSADQASGS
jgi:hypothetical protein